jgi:hypothetical protein
MLAAAFTVACSADSPVAPAVPVTPVIEASFDEISTSPVPLTPLVELNIQTYEGSGQSVHPDVVHFPSPWQGWGYWMVMTPYPKGDEAFENPSILVSHDGLLWQAPAGLTHPLAKTPGKLGYNSDPDMSYDAANNRLVVLYREVTTTQNLIWSTTSTDGVHWSKHTLAFVRPNHSMVSPTVTFGAAGTPMLWYVDAGPKKCAERTTHVMMEQGSGPGALVPSTPEHGWTAPKLNLRQPGKNIWHMDVSWIPERQEYWAVYVAYPGNKCYGQDLFFARSSDGVTWTTYTIPFLRHDEASWTTNTLYRASVLYDASRDAIQFYVSASSADKTWHLGYVDYQLKTFLASLEHGAPVLVPSSSRAPDLGSISEP